MGIHTTAIIHPKSEIDSSVSIGPYSIIEEGVRIEADCRIGPHGHILKGTVMGKGNVTHSGVILGDAPQDLSFKDVETGLKIGEGNVFREHVTVHRGTKEGSETVIGNRNYFMVGSHVAHNCRIGNHVIIANAVLLGGYVDVEDRAFLGGDAIFHQFCRVGTLSMVRGGSRISKDVPPYCIVVENNELVGLNSVGMRRSGMSVESRTRIKEAYSVFFQEGNNMAQALEELHGREVIEEVKRLMDFIRTSKRGISTARRKPTDLGEDMVSE